MANVFLCHRGPDKPLIEKLAVTLEQHGHDVWFDVWALDIGDSIIGKIDAGLARANYLVLCYSSAGDSPYTEIEWQSTLARQLEGHDVTILPALISGGRDAVPAILAGTKYADLVRDWDAGVRALLRAVR